MTWPFSIFLASHVSEGMKPLLQEMLNELPGLGNIGRSERNFWLAGVSVLICETSPKRQHAGCNTRLTTSWRELLSSMRCATTLDDTGESTQSPVFGLLFSLPLHICDPESVHAVRRDNRGAPQRDKSGATPTHSCSSLSPCCARPRETFVSHSLESRTLCWSGISWRVLGPKFIVKQHTQGACLLRVAARSGSPDARRDVRFQSAGCIHEGL